jgi:hypothetical protein
MAVESNNINNSSKMLTDDAVDLKSLSMQILRGEIGSNHVMFGIIFEIFQ